MLEHHRLRINFQTLRETETRLLYREQEMEKILVSMQAGINTYIYGSIGTGKTTTVKHAIEKFSDARNKALYVSCSTCKTEYSVLKEIIDRINDLFVQKIFIETRSNYDLVKRLRKEREKIESLKIVVLDHLQSLEEPETIDGLLEIGFAVILVSDNPKAISKLGPQAQSNFGNTIPFNDYTHEQIVKLLESKARHLLGEGSYRESLVVKVAQLCNGNIGYGETLLLAAALEAVNSKKDTVDETDIPELQTKGETLSHDEKIILEILKEQKSMKGGQLYKAYCERTKFAKAERTFRNYVQQLCEKNLVKAIGTNKGRAYEILEQR
jgi:Cdc6-like AAA superfamily ATPase